MCLFFCNDTATTEIYTLSLHDALPISVAVAATPPILDRGATRFYQVMSRSVPNIALRRQRRATIWEQVASSDRKSTRLNSSHANISYAVFCLKTKNLLKCGRQHV